MLPEEPPPLEEDSPLDEELEDDELPELDDEAVGIGLQNGGKQFPPELPFSQH